MSITFKTNTIALCTLLYLTAFGNAPLERDEKANRLAELNEYELLQEKKVIFISIKEQKLFIIYNKKVIREFAISSSKYGVGFEKGSRKTPVGLHYINRKIGDDVPIQGIF